MSDETEKQEGQKTVVAFIAGLLIGGLLVWVFSATPEDQKTEETSDTDVETVTEDSSNNARESEGTSNVTSNGNTNSSETISADRGGSTPEPAEVVRDGAVSVTDQVAGPVVVLDSLTHPTTAGWIAVRELMDGVPGNILGAARFNESEGLDPTSVNLLRATEAENTYQVVFFNDNGDRVFDLGDDVEIEGVSATFTAQ